MGKKTFRNISYFKGFKHGEGKFEEFLFNTPKGLSMNLEDPVNQSAFQTRDDCQDRRRMFINEAEANLDNKHKGKRGTIIVEFFKTEPFERKQRATFKQGNQIRNEPV